MPRNNEKSPNKTTACKQSNKKFVQQAFHPSLFMSKPRSISTSEIENIQTQSSSDLTQDTIPPTWQRVPSLRNAKRKKTSSPSPERISIHNQYCGLPVDQREDDLSKNSEPIKKVTKPPPIILYGIKDVNKLTELLENIISKEDFTYKIVNQNQLRINCQTIDSYKKTVSIVREKGLIGHTFNSKDERPCRIVIKNLHHTTPITIIKEAIEETGNVVIGEIINAKYGPDKKPTSTFFANLKQNSNNTAVKNIKFIYHQAVTIEDPRKRNTIVQCQRCQQYGHSKNYCMRPYRCVKCAQSHRTADCPKTDRTTPAKCALCLGAHPANYKGCEVYREILERKEKNRSHLINRETNKTIQNSNTQNPLLNSKDNFTQNTNSNKNMRYSDVLRGNKNNDPIIPPTNKTIEDMLLRQAEKFDLILQQMSTLINLITTLVSKISK
ncbi:unnamed protein product [Colias eurytheme]|nr:unnamed protein product [Colias eurytheme]